MDKKVLKPGGNHLKIRKTAKKPAGKKELKNGGKTKQKRQESSFPIVGIGASAGGLNAFEEFFTNMPEHPNMVFVLVSHLDPTHASILPELIGKYTTMEVIKIEDAMDVKSNKVYIIPPDRDLFIRDRVLHLEKPAAARGQRSPIDFFLRSLAEDQKEKAIGIILSGTGSDGTLGLKAIKDEFGMTIVQTPETAEYPGMPVNAIETGMVDYILPPKEMPDQLIKYVTHAMISGVKPLLPVNGKTPETIKWILAMIRNATGHDFMQYKKSTVYRRIERRMNVHQIDSIQNYMTYFQRNPSEIILLFKELLIGVTTFFRDPDEFEVLKEELSRLLKSRPEDSVVRMWVPGCSTGEEAYSIAMLAQECMENNRSLHIQIFATDIDPDAIEKAREGVYPNTISADVSSERLKRFFTREGDSYVIKKNLREMLVFATQSIIKDPPFTKLDLISCRNVLIYLEPELQKKLIPLFHYSLNPNGVLFLGTSESIGGFMDLFSPVDKKGRLYRRKDTLLSKQATLVFPTTMSIGNRDKTQYHGSVKKPNITDVGEKVILEEFGPPSAIVDRKGDILYFHGRTGMYLEPPHGEAKMNIIEMAREGLKIELASAIRKAVRNNRKIIYRGVKVKTNGSFRLTDLMVKPLKESAETADLLLVAFRDAEVPAQETAKKAKKPLGKSEDERIKKMEQELSYTKENLQTTIEELETSNEELKSTNEELQSTNEELQSSNEELETSKEELQSLNEELVTVNSELQKKMDEVTTTNTDIKNLLDSIEIPTIFLDNNLLVKRFTSQAKDIIHLIDSDVGRPVSHIVSKLKYGKLVEDANEVLSKLKSKKVDVQTKDNQWYQMRIVPYRTADNMIDGLVITFHDTRGKKIAASEKDEPD